MSSISSDDYEPAPKETTSSGLQPLTWLLAFALLALNLQMMSHPARTLQSFAGALLSLLDFRQWSQFAWLLITVVGVAVLTFTRFGHEWKTAWARRRVKTASRRADARSRKARDPQTTEETAADYEARIQRDREWRERAKNRMPFS